jgi:hypothetical protein
MMEMLSKPETFAAADLANCRASGIHAFHIAIGMGGPEAFQNTLQFVAGWDGFLAHHSETLKRIDSAVDIDAARAAGKIGVIIGLQNSEHFRTAADVDLFYHLGQRVSQLTYNARNMIGNGSTERHDEGLSDFGLSIVERMNRVGMVVDVSHCGDRTTLDAFEASKKPVLIDGDRAWSRDGNANADSAAVKHRDSSAYSRISNACVAYLIALILAGSFAKAQGQLENIRGTVVIIESDGSTSVIPSAAVAIDPRELNPSVALRSESVSAARNQARQ